MVSFMNGFRHHHDWRDWGRSRGTGCGVFGCSLSQKTSGLFHRRGHCAPWASNGCALFPHPFIFLVVKRSTRPPNSRAVSSDRVVPGWFPFFSVKWHTLLHCLAKNSLTSEVTPPALRVQKLPPITETPARLLGGGVLNLECEGLEKNSRDKQFV